ncbi:phenazine biosynthesis protein PhzF family [Rhodopseudomonas palustris TIE-1]|uniref:PhzF family phenazine biosynthesis protein n=1 Tax=Rhodopseudomonas palustris TaxID=1076 RepID=UPI0001779815|nr:PhzF family phenazine biosynthesis protein [Rhodopseudomonas palustris]ACF02092.1 phenazine biosynthesis protein PhzF family [Rhodopseudomonas palustris TIE-1]
MRLQFETVDVFTAEQFSGNPLAVVLNAEGLSAAQMQAIAGEFNLSETTFVLPPQDPAHTAQVRIFTPNGEMPFAGHPNVGTAFVLARIGQSYGRSIAGDRVVFEEKAGLVPIELIKDGGAVTGARLNSPQSLSLVDELAPDVIAAACSLSEGDIEIANHRPCIASCGAAFIVAEVNNRAALTAASPRIEIFRDRIAGAAATSILLYTQVEEDTIDIRARMFAPLHKIPEDPATGSANVALIGLLAKLRPETDLTLSKTILQGFEIGRPSLLFARAEKRGGEVITTAIGGHCVAVMSGTIGLK